MRYASVCDGIGAAHVAWQPLGWHCEWTAEIDAFPAAVVEQRWGFPNRGDMTRFKEWDDGPIELLAGGTPCQSFSVAGLRKGLHDPRGGLMLTFLEIAQRYRPQWVVWENVPGVLSSNGGRDFGAFLGALGELGYGWAYRVLDAQWFGVAQRRRRVFVVGCLGDERSAAAVLFESESVRRDNPPSRAKGEGATISPALRARANCSHRADTQAYVPDVSPALKARDYKGPSSDGDGDGDGATLVPIAFHPTQYPISSDGGLTHSLGCGSSRGCATVAVAFTKSKRAQSATDDESWVPGEVAPTFNCFDQGDTRATTVVAFTQNSRDEVRQINGDGQLAGALSAEAGMHQTNYIAFANRTRDGIKVPEVMKDGVTPALTNPGDGGRSDAVNVVVPAAQAFTHSGYSNKPAWITGDRTDCLPSSGHGDTSHQGIGVMTPIRLDFQNCANTGDISGTLMGEAQKKGGEAGHGVWTPMAVRRLTPRECERLQGFPDDYTAIEYRKKPAADAPRYKALGNSMAVPVMAWIGRRIAAASQK